MKSRRETKSILATTICHIFWGFSFFASRTALDEAPVFVLLSHRFMLAFLLMTLLVLLRAAELHLKGKKLLPLLMLGLAEPIVYFLGEQYGILHSNTIFSGVMIATIPIVSTLLAAPVLRERPSLGQILFSLLSVGGVIGIGLVGRNSGSLDWIGVAALLLAVLSAGAYTLISRGISAVFSPFERTYVMMLEGAVFFSAMAMIRCGSLGSEYWKPLASRDYLLSVLYLSVCCSVICYFLSGYALTNMSVARETVFANLTTAVSVFAGAVFLREPFTLTSFVFCLLILLGIYGVQRAAPENRKRRA